MFRANYIIIVYLRSESSSPPLWIWKENSVRALNLVGIKFGNLAPNWSFKNIGYIWFGSGPNLTEEILQVIVNIGRT